MCFLSCQKRSALHTDKNRGENIEKGVQQLAGLRCWHLLCWCFPGLWISSPDIAQVPEAVGASLCVRTVQPYARWVGMVVSPCPWLIRIPACFPISFSQQGVCRKGGFGCMLHPRGPRNDFGERDSVLVTSRHRDPSSPATLLSFPCKAKLSSSPSPPGPVRS